VDIFDFAFAGGVHDEGDVGELGVAVGGDGQVLVGVESAQELEGLEQLFCWHAFPIIEIAAGLVDGDRHALGVACAGRLHLRQLHVERTHVAKRKAHHEEKQQRNQHVDERYDVDAEDIFSFSVQKRRW